MHLPFRNLTNSKESNRSTKSDRDNCIEIVLSEVDQSIVLELPVIIYTKPRERESPAMKSPHTVFNITVCRKAGSIENEGKLQMRRQTTHRQDRTQNQTGITVLK